jgi:ribose-phosphate pyrophosphokinase
VEELSARYCTDRETLIRQINLINDVVMTPSFSSRGPRELRTPRFKTAADFSLFANGEVKAELMDSVRSQDVYVVQDVENHFPVVFNKGKDSEQTAVFSVNDHLMAVYVTVDAVKQAGAERVTVVLPTYPYSRQHKKNGREGLAAGRVGMILESLGVDRIITLDIHSQEIGNAFRTIKLENLRGSFQLMRQLLRNLDRNPDDTPRMDDLVVLAPDTGAVSRNKFYANHLKRPLSFLYKERDYSQVSTGADKNNIIGMQLLGEVKDKTVFIADDMIGTGGTLIESFKFLKSQGAKKVIAAVSLPLFSGNAIEKFDEAYKAGLFDLIIGTNAVYQERLIQQAWYNSVDITRLFAQTIFRLHRGKPLSSLLDNHKPVGRLLSELNVPKSDF